jgi:hypothetical protein
MARDRTEEARWMLPSFIEWLVTEKMELDGYAAYTYVRKLNPNSGRFVQKELGLALLKLAQHEYEVEARKRERDEEMKSNPLAGTW